MENEFSINFMISSDNIKIYADLPKTNSMSEVITLGNRIGFALNSLFNGDSNEFIKKAIITNKQKELANYVAAQLHIEDMDEPVISPLECLSE